MAFRLVAFIVGSVVFVLALAFLVAFIVGSVLVPWMAGNRVSPQNPYASVATLDLPVKSFNVSSTAGPLVLPVPGMVNVITPQYVGCPDVCHWETAILVALFQYVVEGGLKDRAAFVTIGVDPWSENLDIARSYQRVKAGQWLDKGILWAWVYDDVPLMERLWEEYRIYVERDNKTGLVNHFAGFIVVVDGKIKYLVVPTAEGWAKPAEVARILYDIIRREAIS